MQRNIVFLLLIILSTGASAQIVKCRDGNGKLQFADRCPTGTQQVQEVDRQVPAAGAATEGKTWQQRETEFQIRQSERNSKAKKDERANTALSNESTACRRARAMVAAIKEKRAFRAPGGLLSDARERVHLDDSELVLFENDVKNYCVK